MTDRIAGKKVSRVTISKKPDDKLKSPAAPARASWDQEMLGRLPPDLRKGLEDLKKNEGTIRRKLSEDPGLRDLFLKAPGEAIAQMGISVDPAIRRLARVAKPEEVLGKLEFSLPDGRRVRPVVTVDIRT